MRILLCDDEPLLRATLGDDLEDAGHAVELASNGDEALTRIKQVRFDAVVTDLAMPGTDGMAVLAAARARGMDVVMITGHGSVNTAVEAIRAGAFDFLEKPFVGAALVRVMERIEQQRRNSAHPTDGGPSGFDKVKGGASPAFAALLDMARRAAATDASLLIIGESGSGKEVLAKAVHEASTRCGKPFVPVSCGAITSTLLDDELFGHEKGAFTDAKTARPGRFEEAEGGTLFLDDIDDMRLDMQVKLLRVIQEREVRRIGATDSRKIDIRIIAASKVDLEEHVRAGQFRLDLLYRLQVLRLDIPPLRQRPEDIPDLLEHFIAKHAAGPMKPLSEATKARAMAYPWPGNIRQLENAVCRALALRSPGEEITAADLLPDQPPPPQAPGADLTLATAVRIAELEHIHRVLDLCQGNRSKAAGILGISRKTLWEKLKGDTAHADTVRVHKN